MKYQSAAREGDDGEKSHRGWTCAWQQWRSGWQSRRRRRRKGHSSGYETLVTMMWDDSFHTLLDSMLPTLCVALGVGGRKDGEEDALELVLSLEDVDVNITGDTGATALLDRAGWSDTKATRRGGSS